jgi:plastocyanin
MRNALLFLGFLLALACAPAHAEDLAVYRVDVRDGAFEPATIEVPAGKRFKLEVSNVGKGAIEFESRDLRQEKVVAPGAKASFVINALKPGTYTFFDEYHAALPKGKIVAK